jgi:hypothetical protein
VLHLATTTCEADVEMALTLLLDAVYELVREFRPALVPQGPCSSLLFSFIT